MYFLSNYEEYLAEGILPRTDSAIIVLLNDEFGDTFLDYFSAKCFYSPSRAINTTVILSAVFLWKASFITFSTASPQN